MTTQIFVKRCQQIAAEFSPAAQAGSAPAPDGSDSDSLIGFFQLFRPDGKNLEPVFELLDLGDNLHDRMQSLFESAGNDRRPQGGRDAYFIVRDPKPLSVEVAEHHCQTWLEGLCQIAAVVGEHDLVETLSKQPRIRVLEGIPPKHPKPHEGRVPLLTALLDESPKLTSKISGVDPHAEVLQAAYYFVACDAMLRDYLMWPFYAEKTGLGDPLRGYFMLWSHGVKYRIFQDEQIDLYLPRQV